MSGESEKVGREEFLLLKEMLIERFDTHEKRDDERFESMAESLRDVPRKSDLEHATITVNTRIDSYQQALAEKQAESEKRAARTRWLIGVVVAVVFPITMAVLKKVGVL